MFKRLGAFFLDTIQVIVFAVAIFLFIYLLILQPHKIKGDSMQPNFPNGEYLLTDKVTYRFNDPKRGDVVVFKAPTGNGDEFIKRIIGLSGEEVYVQNGKVYINGKLLEEPYLAESLYTSGSSYLKEGEKIIVPEGSFLVFGDNRPRSSDSRVFGPITKDVITGRAWLIYWPIKNAGVVSKVNYSL